MEKEKIISIIIPYYKTLELTKELFEVLTPQLNDDIEVIIVDDGCNEVELDNLKAKVIHLPENSGNASTPRNVGLDNAKGKYIAFIDSDDLVSENYIETLLEYTKLDKDVIYISWKAKGIHVVMYDEPPQWNCSVWCRIYKKDVIGDVRFDKELDIAEDWKFVHSIEPKTSISTTRVVYYYNNNREGSLFNTKKV